MASLRLRFERGVVEQGERPLGLGRPFGGGELDIAIARQALLLAVAVNEFHRDAERVVAEADAAPLGADGQDGRGVHLAALELGEPPSIRLVRARAALERGAIKMAVAAG